MGGRREARAHRLGFRVAATLLLAAVALLAPDEPASRRATAAAASATEPAWRPIYRIGVVVASSGGPVRIDVRGGYELVEAAVERGRHADVHRFVRGQKAAFRGFPRRPLRTRGSGRSSFLLAVAPRDERPLQISVAASTAATVRIVNRNRTRRVPIAAERVGGFERLRIPTDQVAERGPVPGTEPLPPSVYAFYYQWYDVDDWYGGKPIRGDNTNPVPYDSRDPAAIDRHILEARQAGLDGFIVSWLGSGTQVDDATKVLMSRLPPGFRFALYIEIHYPAFLTMEGLVDQLEYLLETYATHPNYLRYEGRPLIYVWSALHVFRDHFEPWNPDYLKVWRQVLDELARRGHHPALFGEARPFVPRDYTVFTGMHSYMINSEEYSRRLNERMSLVARAWASIHGGPRRIFGATPLPGYDDRHISGRPYHYHFPREQGSFYRRQWSSATETGADQALVISFNEWMETTNIEPNVQLGTEYIDLTRELANAFRASRA